MHWTSIWYAAHSGAQLAIGTSFGRVHNWPRVVMPTSLKAPCLLYLSLGSILKIILLINSIYSDVLYGSQSKQRLFRCITLTHCFYDLYRCVYVGIKSEFLNVYDITLDVPWLISLPLATVKADVLDCLRATRAVVDCKLLTSSDNVSLVCVVSLTGNSGL
jgi:hypothetical protein